MASLRILLLLLVLALLSFVTGLSIGSTSLNLFDIGPALWSTHPSIARTIIYTVRLPHSCSAFVTGSMLALAGNMMQVLLRNPLADPYILGISSGATLCTLAATLLGLSGYALVGSAWVGSLLSTLLLTSSMKHHKAWNPFKLLLIGVVFTSLLSAITSTILLLLPAAALRSMLFWLVGDFTGTQLPTLGIFILAIGFLGSLYLARPMNLLLYGELQAQTMGLNCRKTYYQLYFLSSLLTAAAVSQAGCIGFVGLITPHILRSLGCTDQQYLVPGCLLLGGSILCLADAFSRSIVAPQQLPAGLIMALGSGPVLIFLLLRKMQ